MRFGLSVFLILTSKPSKNLGEKADPLLIRNMLVDIS